MKPVLFSDHAEFKLEILVQHGVRLTKEQVVDVVRDPETIQQGYKDRLIAQKLLDQTHVLRVVYEEYSDELKIITFYPARRERYEN